MVTGTVKWFNAERGFGMIKRTDGEQDTFVHISAVHRSGLRALTQGQKVEFEVGKERGRKLALRIWPQSDVHGTVARFDRKIRFGFITPDGGGEMFVHISDVLESGHETLTPTQRVVFDVLQYSKGRRKAVNIRLEN